MAGYYWYGSKRKGPVRPPRWVDNLLTDTTPDNETAEKPCDEVNETEFETETEELQSESTPESESTISIEDQEPAATRKQSGRYSLRGRVHPPDRFQ